MKSKIINLNWERAANTVMICAMFAVLMGAFVVQVFWHELPCPLCMLQRAGFIAMIYGLLMNLRYEIKPFHYTITLISGLFTAAVALRQIVLHIIPGSGSYGSSVMGYHLYTWSFIAAVLVILGVSVLLGSNRQYSVNKRDKHWELAAKILFDIAIILIIANIISVFAICGIGYCPDTPTGYLFG